MKESADFPVLLQLFFTKRLIAQRRASPHTIASYRDTFRLLLQFAEKELNKRPSEITFDDLSPTFIGAFLDDLERRRRRLPDRAVPGARAVRAARRRGSTPGYAARATRAHRPPSSPAP